MKFDKDKVEKKWKADTINEMHNINQRAQTNKKNIEYIFELLRKLGVDV